MRMNDIDNDMTWRFSEKSHKLEFTSRISISIGPWRLENTLPSCGKSSYLSTFSPPINSTSMGKFMLCTGAIKNICVPRRKSSRLGLQNCLWISASRMGFNGWRHLYKRKLAFGQECITIETHFSECPTGTQGQKTHFSPWNALCNHNLSNLKGDIVGSICVVMYVMSS